MGQYNGTGVLIHQPGTCEVAPESPSFILHNMGFRNHMTKGSMRPAVSSGERTDGSIEEFVVEVKAKKHVSGVLLPAKMV